MILECKKQLGHYSTIVFLNDCDLDMYRRKSFVLEKGLEFSFANLVSTIHNRIKMFMLECENRSFDSSRTYYQNEIKSYKEEKRYLENENIVLNNSVFVIDYELKKDFVDPNNVDDKSLFLRR